MAFCDASERAYLMDIEKLTGVRLTVVGNGVVDMPARAERPVVFQPGPLAPLEEAPARRADRIALAAKSAPPTKAFAKSLRSASPIGFDEICRLLSDHHGRSMVFADGQAGIIEASATRRFSIPCTFRVGSTTAMGSVAGPILAVPQRCQDDVPTWPA